MTVLFVLHDRLSSAIIMFALACAVWGMWAGWRRQAVTGDYWGALVIGEWLVVAQGLIGLAMLIAGRSPDRTVHGLYGLLTGLVWPAVYVYTRGRDGRREMLLYGLASLLIVTLAGRAMMTG